MIIGSFFGDNGTIYGAAIGSVVSGAASEGYEYVLVRSHAKAKSAYRHLHPMMETLMDAQQPAKPRAHARVWPDGDGMTLYERIEARPGGQEELAAAKIRQEKARKKYDKRMLNGKKPWVLAGSGLAIAGVSLGIAYGVVLLPTEAATGKTLASHFPGNKTQYGSSFGSTSSTPPATVSPSATPSGSVQPSQSLTETPAQTPQASVSPSSVPSVTPTPTVTMVPVSISPAPQDSATELP
jgi:hypothetical protein